MALRARYFVLSGLLAVGCLHAMRPPADSAEPGALPALSAQSAAVVGAPAAVANPTPKADLDLQKFRPLLARAELREVRLAVDEDRLADACRILSAEISKGSLTGVERARLVYLLGLLEQGAGQKTESVVHFQEASTFDWILRDDALLHVAELQIELGQGARALLSIEQATSLSDSNRAIALRARALDVSEEAEQAVAAWEAVVEKDSSASAHFALARALLKLAEKQPAGEARMGLAGRAQTQAEQARIGLGDEDDMALKVAELIQQAVKNGAPPAPPLTPEDRLAHLRGLVESGEDEEALEVAKTLEIPQTPTFSQARCESDFWIGKALTNLRRWGEGAEKITASANGCTSDPQLHAWLLFNAGKYSAADGRQTKAITFYDELERLYPKNSLADDARIRSARSYLAAGVPARYVALLQALPEDYPDGDMTMEGVLELALYRIERNDWSGAAQVLERGARIVRAEDSARGHEYAGTERYFLARCKQELDDEDAALSEFEAIVREVPLSYYMLHAYSRLLEADPKRAKAALAQAQKQALSAPFQFPHREEYETPEFERGMELLRVGESERGQEILAQLGLGPSADDSLLWGIALLYDRAGDAHESHGIARGRLTDWLAHYPAGDWKSPWEIGFPRPYLPMVQRESKATGVPEWLIYGVMREESTFRPHVVSHANAYGLMQIIEPTARGIGKKAGLPYTAEALKRPSVNIAIGSRVLKELNRRFASNPWLAIPAYNAGPGRPISWLSERPNVDFDVWVEMIPYRETRRYTKRVLASRAAYAFIYDQENAQTALVLPKRLTPP